MIDHYLTPNEYFKCEQKTLEFLTNNPYCNEHHFNLATDARNTTYKHQYSKRQLACLSFESKLNIEIEKKEALAHIGFTIKTEEHNRKNFYDVTHCLTIIKEDLILRKFHFDYVPPGRSPKKQKQPRYHLQYGGELTPMLKKMGVDDKAIFTKLSEPRIIFQPMTLALLINLVLKEFPDLKNVKLLESNEWRGLVRKNEELVLEPYYKSCCQFFQNKSKSGLFTNDFCYGE